MARFPIPQGKFQENNWQRVTEAIRNSVETHDFDSGWFATPADKIIQHKLGLLPKTVLVYASANANGNPMQSDSFTACDINQVTITGPLAFCRVLVNA
jgi:hypothetical protein